MRFRFTVAAGSSPLTRGKPRIWSAIPSSRGLIPAHAGKTPGPGPLGLLGRAHPRSRGENFTQSRAPEKPPGSSPLTRGKPWRVGPDDLLDRLIPAHAGKTSNRGCSTVDQKGSSPLTRGKRAAPPPSVQVVRLIPAHAGKTGPETISLRPARAHPRSRGENQKAAIEEQKGKGSSPLTRGKPAMKVTVMSGTGLIPAHAGKTLRYERFHVASGAHPRSRGENDALDSHQIARSGSSPLTRGKLTKS